jgi:hypothetical protein
VAGAEEGCPLNELIGAASLTTVHLAPWNRDLKVAIYRKRVFYPSVKNFQLDLFDPSNS